MSLDVTIVYKEPKTRHIGAGFDVEPCGSNMAYYDKDTDITESEWSANVTHNMGLMARNIPVQYSIEGETYEESLYSLVWEPEEVGIGNICNNTNIVKQALQSGISYMISHRDDLIQYNPSNGWGSYESFLKWLIDYWNACIENPDCRIEVWR